MVYKNRGFTIVELLVVIAVIAILAAITVVAYTNITNKAQAASLQSSLGQAVKALETYKVSTSGNETYPTTANLSSLNLKFDNFITTNYYPSSDINPTGYCYQGTLANGTVMSISSTSQGITTKPCIQNGLVGWWKLNGDATDSSGLGNNGTIGSVPSVAQGSIVNVAAPLTNGAYSFDGIDDSVSMANSSSLSAIGRSFALSFWVYPLAYSNIRMPFFLTFSSSSYPYVRFFQDSSNFSSGTFEYDIVGISPEIGNLRATINSGEWTHILLYFDGYEMKMYRNGVLSSSSSVSVSLGSLQTIYIGKMSNGLYPYNGSIDDVRLYNRALSATEIQQLYSAGAQ